MKAPMILSTVVVIILFTTNTLYSQSYDDKSRMKFGKVEMWELDMTTYPQDTGAAALILADYGQTIFSYSQNKGYFEIFYERHCRVKILKNSGYEYANIEIPLRISGATKEIVTNLKASTYNLDNGKIVEHKLARKDIFDDKSSESWTVKKFTLPNLEVGSVFEFSYKIVSDFDIIRNWQFQMDIPVAWSEYTIKVPQYYKFLKFSQGYESFYKDERKTESATRSFKLSNGQTQTEPYINEVNYWAVKDAPGFGTEKFITTQNDFYTKIEFQVATFHMPPGHMRNILADWPEVQKKLLDHEKFGNQINRSGFMRAELQALVKGCPDDHCKISKIYDFIRQNMEWNERKTFLCESNLRKAFSDKVGNSADINLMLVSALREIGLQADPVILSTRDNGRIHPVYPIIGKYNYVIVAVNTEGKYVLLDATDKFIVPGQLPTRCLNFQGRLISETNSRWIELNNRGESSNMFTANLTLGEDGTMAGRLVISSGGYDAVNKRKAIVFNSDEYLKNLKEEKKSWEIVSNNFENLEKISERLVSKYEVRISDAAQLAGNVIFINPMLTEGIKENPFKQEKRIFPIDFTHPSINIFHLSLEIPEGFDVEELPKNAVWALPENAGSFSYNILKNGNIINITTNYNIKNSFFGADSFPVLKEFHNLIVAKCAEQIVIKKKT
jgi:hypothetical protein